MKFIINHILFKYLVSGGTAAFTDLVLLHLLDKYSGFHYLISVNIAFIIAFFVSFSLQKYWTFDDRKKGETKKQMVKYFIISVLNVFINTAFVHFILVYFVTPEWLILRPVVVAQIISSAVIAIESFFVYKYFIFANAKQALNNKMIDDTKEVLL